MRRVLLIGQDLSRGLAPSLLPHLQSHAQVRVAVDLKTCLEMAAAWSPQVILMDCDFGESAICEAVGYLRRSCVNHSSLIVCFGKAFTSEQRTRGFEEGVDDFLETERQSKKEIFAQLSARFRALNWEAGTPQTVVMGNLTILPETLQVKIGEEQVKLTQMEVELLRYFVEHPNRIIPRGKLLGDLWPDAIVTDRTVDTHVANLRKKIRGFCYELGTVYGAGYILKT